MHGKQPEPEFGLSVLRTAARLRHQLPTLALLGLSLFVLLGPTDSVAGETIYTGRHALKIPFDFKDEQIRQLRATEVQLLVSSDRGKSWKTASRAKPQDRQFRYNASENGEYWFAVRMMNSQNQPVQPGVPQVGLKVTVDDVPPVLDLKVRELSPGRVELTWQAEDEALNLQTLEIQYREGPDGEWKSLNSEGQSSGRLDLPVSAAGTVFVAARVSDQAKNEVTAQSQTSVSDSSQAPERVTEPDFSKPVAIIPGRSIPDHSPQGPIMPQIITESSLEARPVPQTISQQMTSPVIVQPAHASRYSAFPSGAKVVKANAFNIGYSLDQIGPSGVGAVDLYITEDSGRSWFHYGTDPDRKSPFSRARETGLRWAGPSTRVLVAFRICAASLLSFRA